jgi:hypothetical protein
LHKEALNSVSKGAIALSTENFERKIEGQDESIKDLRFAIGNNFGVSENGTLYTKNSNISGNIYADYINAEDGKIGGWTIGKTTIKAGSTTLNSSGIISIKPGTKYFVSMGKDTDYLSTGGLNVGKDYSTSNGVRIYNGGLQIDGEASSKSIFAAGKIDAHGGFYVGDIPG